MQCVNQVKFCRTLMRPCDHVGREESCASHEASCLNGAGKTVPTLGIVVSLYTRMHSVEGRGTLKPHNRAVVTEINRFMRTLGIDGNASVEYISMDSIQTYIDRIGGRNITKIGMCQRIQCLIGRRERTYYRRNGYTVRPTDVPAIKDDSRAYRSTTPSRTFDVLKWYRGLCTERNADPRRRIFVMMMFKCAMRVLRGDRLEVCLGGIGIIHIHGRKLDITIVPCL